MEISVQGTHEETVRPEVARLNASATAEAGSKDEVLRTATAVVNRLAAELNRLQDGGAVSEVVVRPISTSSWRPVARGKQQPPVYRAHASMRADFTEFTELADLAARLGGIEGLELDWVEWRITDATRLELEGRCLTRAVEQARERALVMARAAGESQVSFVQLADPGLLGAAPAAGQQMFASAAPMDMMRSAEELDGIELRPEDLTVSAAVQARFVTS